MTNKILILYIPVIHKGYLDFFKRIKNKVFKIFIIDDDFQKELSETKPDIASLDAKIVKDLLEKIGFENISILSKDNINEVRGKEIMLVQDEISRNLAEKYLKGEIIEWDSVFLRWDKEKVLIRESFRDIPVSKDEFDILMIREAQKEAQKTGDWWRQIGAVLVKDKEILIRGYNKDLPSDHTPYQVGEVRDFFKAGERHELASTIHAEESIIAKAAKEGISLKETALYVTTFPCPVCAKLIACSGIKNLYFSEGGSNFDAKKVLDSADINIYQVPQKNI
jgi:deoxycytidylate deaminase